jgi:hypothetical protein
MRRLIALLSLIALPALAGPPDPNMQVSLVAEQPGVAPGGSVRLGLKLKSDPGWHTYWRNPGDAGSPSEIGWSLPEGVGAGPIEWPVPQVIKEGDVVIFGYEGEVLLPSTLSVPPAAQPGESIPVKALAYWVVCREVCIPGETELSLDVPVVDRAPAPAAAWPQPPAKRSGWSARFVQDEAAIRLNIATKGEQLEELRFLPYAPGQVRPDAPQPAAAEGPHVILNMARAPELQQQLDRLEGLLLATQIVEGRREPFAAVVEATR